MEYPPFYNPEYETLERSELEALQLKRLKETVVHCMQSPFYKKRFAENKLTPDSIQSLDDLKRIPFTTKQDLRDIPLVWHLYLWKSVSDYIRQAVRQETLQLFFTLSVTLANGLMPWLVACGW